MNYFDHHIALRTLEDEPSIAVIEMRDIRGKNALTPGFVERFLRVVEQEIMHNGQIHVVIIAGLEEVFCSGADQNTLIGLANGEIKPTDLLLPKVILDIPVPVIAAMAGHAIGGGLALGLCADIVLISKESRYGCSFVNMGFTPGMGATKLLENILSPAIAHELQYTGEYRLGREFIGKSGFNEILSREEVFPKAIEIALRIAEKPRLTLEILKRYLSKAKRTCFEETITVETLMHQICFSQPSIKEYINENYAQ